mmetsp:Transcript_44708/g.104167  ORF Transcript_44708/g.104167 Transcript_44708/m.104167 type:complete len:231 (+) Transcript_44708:985-1677(+)
MDQTRALEEALIPFTMTRKSLKKRTTRRMRATRSKRAMRSSLKTDMSTSGRFASIRRISSSIHANDTRKISKRFQYKEGLTREIKNLRSAVILRANSAAKQTLQQMSKTRSNTCGSSFRFSSPHWASIPTSSEFARTMAATSHSNRWSNTTFLAKCRTGDMFSSFIFLLITVCLFFWRNSLSASLNLSLTRGFSPSPSFSASPSLPFSTHAFFTFSSLSEAALLMLSDFS